MCTNDPEDAVGASTKIIKLLDESIYAFWSAEISSGGEEKPVLPVKDTKNPFPKFDDDDGVILKPLGHTIVQLIADPPAVIDPLTPIEYVTLPFFLVAFILSIFAPLMFEVGEIVNPVDV